MAIPTTPFMIHKREKAPEVRALLQPKSLSIGLKKTPKAVFEPMAPRKMRNAAVTTRLPEKSDKEAPPNVLRCLLGQRGQYRIKTEQSFLSLC